MGRSRNQKYEIRQGKRLVALADASTAYYAVLDYVRTLGCRDDEITRFGTARIGWRGAVYTAVPVTDDLRERRRSSSDATRTVERHLSPGNTLRGAGEGAEDEAA